MHNQGIRYIFFGGAEKGAEKAAKEAAEKATEKTAKETAEKAAEEAAQSAYSSAHVPVLAAGKVVKQRLIIPAHDNADIVYARVHQRGQSKINKSVSSAERQRGRRAAAH